VQENNYTKKKGEHSNIEIQIQRRLLKESKHMTYYIILERNKEWKDSLYTVQQEY
jgi:hypothetical protein